MLLKFCSGVRINDFFSSSLFYVTHHGISECLMNSNYFIFTKMLLIGRFFFKNILENIGSGELMSKLLTG